MSPTQVRSATPASVWTPAEQKPSLGAAQGSLKSQREPAQQRPLRLEAPSRSAPSKGGTSRQLVRRVRARLHGDRTANHAGLDLSSGTRGTVGDRAQRGRDQGGRQGRGGLEGSVWGRVLPSRGEEAPGPRSPLTRPVPRSLQLPLHTGGRIRGKVPLAGRRGHYRRRRFLPHVHGFNVNLDPKWPSTGDSARRVPTWYLSGPPPLWIGRLSTSRENCFPFSFCFPAAALSNRFSSLSGSYRERKKFDRKLKGTRVHVLFSRYLQAAILLLPLTDSLVQVTGTPRTASGPSLTMLSRVVLSAAAAAGKRCRPCSDLSVSVTKPVWGCMEGLQGNGAKKGAASLGPDWGFVRAFRKVSAGSRGTGKRGEWP